MERHAILERMICAFQGFAERLVAIGSLIRTRQRISVAFVVEMVKHVRLLKENSTKK